MKVIKTALLIIALLLIGCTENDLTYNEPTTEVSNIGNSLNGLGYYEGNTTFGNIEIDGYSTLYVFDEDNNTISNLIPDHFQYHGELVYKDTDNVFTLYAQYGVSEDGKTMYMFTGDDVELTYLYQINDGCDAITDGDRKFMMCGGD